MKKRTQTLLLNQEIRGKNSTRCFTPLSIFLTLISWSPSKASTIPATKDGIVSLFSGWKTGVRLGRRRVATLPWQRSRPTGDRPSRRFRLTVTRRRSTSTAEKTSRPSQQGCRQARKYSMPTQPQNHGSGSHHPQENHPQVCVLKILQPYYVG